MPLGDHRGQCREYLSADGQIARGYWSGRMYAKMPLRSMGDEEPLDFAPIALREPLPDRLPVDLVWTRMDIMPDVQPSEEGRFLVAWRSKTCDHSSSGEMYYLNAFPLRFDEGDQPHFSRKVEGTDQYLCFGWFDRYEDADGSATYRPMSEQYVEHLRWSPMPTLPEAIQ
jgi:hypothetical protein